MTRIITMLNTEQLKRLNDQVNIEASASRLYLSVSCWAASQGLDGVASFFKAQHEEEEEHMHKLEEYIISTGGRVVIGAVEAPPADFKDISSILKMALEKEVEVSKNINKMVHAFLQEQDYSTFNFLQWFVAEQHQEEHLFRSLIEKAELIGSDEKGIFWLDKELGNINKN